MATRDDAVAELAESVGQALLRFAVQLRSLPPTEAGGSPAPHPRATPGLGAAQQRVLDALVAAGEAGMTSHEVAKATELQNSNTPRILKTLQGRGLVRSKGEKPAVWVATPVRKKVERKLGQGQLAAPSARSKGQAEAPLHRP